MTSEVFLRVTNYGSVTRTLDLFENEVVALNWQFTDLQNFGVVGTYSKQFRVPNTPNNNEIFGSAFNPNQSDSTWNFFVKAPAELFVNTIPITRGHIQLRQVITRLGQIHEYEIVFYTETPDLGKSLGTKKLVDLDYTDITHQINYTNVTTNQTEYIYALMDRGQKWSEDGEIGSRPILNLSQPIFPNELVPCLSARYLFDKILSNVGYSYTGIALQDELDRYWLPCANEPYTAIDKNPQDFVFRLGLYTDESGLVGSEPYDIVPNLTEDYDNNGDVSSGVYTVPYSGWFTFRIWFTIETSNANTQIFGVRLRQTTDDVTLWSANTVSIDSQSGAYNLQHTTAPIFLAENQTIELQYKLQTSGTFTIKSSATNNPSEGTGWELLSAGTAVSGEDISWKKNVPDMTQIDFIKAMISMHNCVVIPDREESKKLEFIPIMDYLDAGSTKDWTDKIDLNKDITLAPTTEFQSAQLTFTYADGEDVGSQLYNAQNRIYGDYDLLFDGESYQMYHKNDFAQGETKIELPFQSIPSILIGGTSIPIHKFVNETGEFQKPKPTIFYNAGTAEVSLYDDVAIEGVLTTVNLLSNYSVVYPNSLFIDDLNWSPEVDLYPHNITPLDNLFNRFYRDYVREIYSPEARIMDAYFHLTNTDILNFKFNDQIFVKESYWRILAISDYDFEGSPSYKVRLIKRVVPAEFCNNAVPDTVSASGIVSWLDKEGNPTGGSETCCLAYGWFWSTANGGQCSTISGASIEKRRFAAQRNFNVNTNSQIESSVTRATSSTISNETVQSMLLGTDLTIEDGNAISVIGGSSLKLLGQQNGAAIFGKNAVVQYPGVHLGGGWLDDVDYLTDGMQQMGMIMYAGDGDFDSNNSEIQLTIDGIRYKHLDIPDETMWTVELSLSVVQYAAGAIVGTGHGLFLFDLYKSAGVTNAGTVTTIHESSSHGSYSVILDDTTNTDQCRIRIKSNGGSYPYNGIRIVATLKYNQIRILS